MAIDREIEATLRQAVAVTPAAWCLPLWLCDLLTKLTGKEIA